MKRSRKYTMSVRADGVRRTRARILEAALSVASTKPPAGSLVIGHGGHATSLRALAHGLPLLVVPAHPMLDQTMVGQAVARYGARLVLPRSSSPERIREAISRLLETSSYAASAATLGTRIRAGHGTHTAAAALLGLVQPAPR